MPFRADIPAQKYKGPEQSARSSPGIGEALLGVSNPEPCLLHINSPRGQKWSGATSAKLPAAGENCRTHGACHLFVPLPSSLHQAGGHQI